MRLIKKSKTVLILYEQNKHIMHYNVNHVMILAQLSSKPMDSRYI